MALPPSGSERPDHHTAAFGVSEVLGDTVIGGALLSSEDQIVDGTISGDAATYPPLRHGVIAFAFLMVAEFFYSWAWNSIDVLRPYIRESLGLTLTEVGSGYSAQGAGALIGAVIIGQLADRFGRRAMLTMVMVGYGVSLIAGTFAGSYPMFLLARFVLGLFMGGIFPIVVGIYVGLFAANVAGRLAAMINAIFGSALTLLGYASGALNGDWHTLLWLGGVPPILLAGLAFVLIPPSADARRMRDEAPTVAPIAELFAPAVRRQTLMLAALMGLNFFGYQAFGGWQTTYLRDVRHLTPTVMGDLVAMQFAANIIGGFFWGWAGDRFGRRFNALGFVATAAAIALYLNLGSGAALLGVVGACYGFMLSSSVVWGPWLTELYPPHLKSTAASIFNWGRIVSFFAPLITGALAAKVGLGLTMGLGSVTFLIAGVLWLLLPETHPAPLLPALRKSPADR